MTRLRRTVLMLSLVILIAVAGAGVYLVRDSQPLETVSMSVLQTGCRTAGGVCEARHMQIGTVRLQFPEGAYYMQPFVAEMQTSGEPALTTVTLDLSMPGMNMGRNRFQLKAVADNLWRGKLLLPVCVTGRVDWQVTLQLDADGRRYQAEFPLNLQSPPAATQ